MILYKYVSLEAAIKILASGTIGFSKFDSFNDPFETLTLVNVDQPDLFGEQLFENVHERYVAACLTRSNLNSLMWSHYADHHKGAVVGYDVTCEELRSTQQNLIPVQFGSVIYSRTMPSGYFEQQFDLGSCFNATKLESLQRAFLMKADSWSYEEEVRIVRALDNSIAISSNEDELFLPPKLTPINEEKTTFILPLSGTSITEVILGCRLDERKEDCRELYKVALKHNPQVKISKCHISRNSWSLEIGPVDYQTIHSHPRDISGSQNNVE